MIRKIWLSLCDHKWNISRIFILFYSPVLEYVGLVLDMSKKLSFACESTVTYLVCVTEHKVFLKTWNLKVISFPFATMLQMTVSLPSVFMLFLQYLFKQHVLQLKMSHGSLIPGNSFYPVLALASFFISFGWAADGFRAWQACVWD